MKQESLPISVGEWKLAGSVSDNTPITFPSDASEIYILLTLVGQTCFGYMPIKSYATLTGYNKRTEFHLSIWDEGVSGLTTASVGINYGYNGLYNVYKQEVFWKGTDYTSTATMQVMYR